MRSSIAWSRSVSIFLSRRSATSCTSSLVANTVNAPNTPPTIANKTTINSSVFSYTYLCFFRNNPFHSTSNTLISKYIPRVCWIKINIKLITSTFFAFYEIKQLWKLYNLTRLHILLHQWWLPPRVCSQSTSLVEIDGQPSVPTLVATSISSSRFSFPIDDLSLPLPFPGT